MRIGYRVIKTGIAVAITTFICGVFRLEPSLFGALSAVINIQPSSYLTFKTAKNQIYVHLLGVLIGMILGYSIGGNPITYGLMAMIVIILYNRLGLQNGILNGIVAGIFILNSSPDLFLIHAYTRSLVIFIGLVVAMIVNFTLWPPRYNQQFLEQLRIFNEKSITYFCWAVKGFTQINDQEILLPEALKQEALSLKKEMRTLTGYLAVQVDNWQAVEQLMEYSETVLEKADRVYELILKRLERRQNLGTPPISDEYKRILDILTIVCPTIFRVNEKLRKSVCFNVEVEPEEIDEVYWERLTGAVEEWQHHLTNSYYLHSLIEVAVVAYEIKWVAQEAKRQINANLKL